jgi:hypothetical protein
MDPAQELLRRLTQRSAPTPVAPIATMLPATVHSRSKKANKMIDSSLEDSNFNVNGKRKSNGAVQVLRLSKKVRFDSATNRFVRFDEAEAVATLTSNVGEKEHEDIEVSTTTTPPGTPIRQHKDHALTEQQSPATHPMDIHKEESPTTPQITRPIIKSPTPPQRRLASVVRDTNLSPKR